MKRIAFYLVILFVAFALTLGSNSQLQASTTGDKFMTQAVVYTADVRYITAIDYQYVIPGAVMVFASAPFCSEVVLYGANTASAPTAIFSMKKDTAGQYIDTKSAAALAATTILGNTSAVTESDTFKATNTFAITTDNANPGAPIFISSVRGSADQNDIRAATANAEPANSGVPLCVGNIDGFSGLNDARAATATGSGSGAIVTVSNASRLQLNNLSGGFIPSSSSISA
jgi:hypothetical protein